MSRPIEFRGYDPDTERWYYGSYVRLERVSGYAMSQTPEEDNRRHEDEDYDDYIFFTEMMDWGLETRKLKATVDPKSVGQFTGLRDKNGRKIYEGDIIRFDYPDDCEEDERDRYWRYDLGGAPRVVTSHPRGWLPFVIASSGIDVDYRYPDLPQFMQVVGNVYAGPDLVEREA